MVNYMKKTEFWTKSLNLTLPTGGSEITVN